jgi:hypothetical protein
MGKADNGFINPSSGSVKEKILSPALAYARRGWPVLPLWRVEDGHCACGQENCSSPGKHPLVPHGVKEATTDPEVIRSWWRRYPKANIGIATGAVSGLLVVDIDPRHGGSLDGLSFPADAPQVQTGGGGRHIYLAWPEGVERLPKTLPGRPGVELKGNGGYVVAPPSLHVSGRHYVWKISPDLVPLAPCPTWLLEAIAAAQTPPPRPRPRACGGEVGTPYGRAALRGEILRLAQAAVGERNNLLNLAAFRLGRLVAAGHLPEEAVGLLEHVALQVGLTPRETTATLRSGLTAGMREGQP